MKETMEAVCASPTGQEPSRWHVGGLVYGVGGLAALFVFLLLGDLAYSLRERAVQEVFKAMLLNLSQNALLLNLLVGALPAAVTTVVAMIAGAWSDRTRTRLGRRIPFLLVSAPVVGLSLIGLAYSDALANALAHGLRLSAQRHETVVLGIMTLFWTLFEVAAVVGNELYYALINDTVPSALIGRFYGVFRMVSLCVGASFFYTVFDDHLLQAVRPVLMGIGLIYVTGFYLMCWRVKEGSYAPPAQRQHSVGGEVRVYVRRVTAVPFFLLLFLMIALAKVSYLIMNTNSMSASVQFGADRADYANATAMTYLCSIVLSFPLGWLIDRLHPLRVGLVVLGLYACAMLAGWVVTHNAETFKVFFLLHGILAGAIFTTTTALLPRLLPRSSFAQLSTVSAALTSLMQVLVMPVTGVLIDWLGGDFRTTFLMAGTIGVAAIGMWLVVMRQFNALGGVQGYVALDLTS